ncbi:MAG TPA: preprotein translocase subunit SecA [Erysipelotrichaceae bacterium]|nr:preprotein translocase subunit SecA [Erysipelotrichaceae bacterium]
MGFFDRRALKKYQREAEKVIAYEKTMAALSDDELRAKTPYFKDLLANGASLKDIKYEAFAVAREAAKRTIGEFPYKVQVIGSLVLHNGDVAEMRTGEGKTLMCTMAVYLNALAGKGVHVITVNEYLCTRDAEWMGQIYRFLGLTVGVNIRQKTTREKQEAYLCDITYTTNSEVGFDYLRDNMATTMDRRVLRGLHFCIVDEADSILIDESRTPLIISGGAKTSASQYTVADRFCKALKKDTDVSVDIKDKTVNLTEAGQKKAERMFGIKNLYDPEYADLVHRIHNALKANYIMGRDVDYLVDPNGEVQIIDPFTGRVLPGREWSDGLHQAVQAKENVKIKQETITMATITYQNFFRLYTKIAGMTGTAKTEEEEFRKIYNMRVVCVPTNKPIIRVDALDYVYARKGPKLAALIKEVKERHEKGQPILIGTVSVESSEEISELLTRAGLKHEMLNAKNHAREAEIIALAGKKGAITLATNMAGRGTDIKIDDEIRALGGLCVFGTERHESRRIDNQLRGRSGRQGDPGFSRFYVSFEDTLLVRFAADSIKNYIEKNFGDEALEAKMITNVITSAQKKIEGQNFDTRKSLLEYDDVLAKQRQIIYDKRDRIIEGKNIDDIIDDVFKTTGQFLAKKGVPADSNTQLVFGDQLVKAIEPRFLPSGTINPNLFDDVPVEDIGPDLSILIKDRFDELIKTWDVEESEKDNIKRSLILHCIDQNWTKHIDSMARLREAIFLRSYANVNPLQAYVNEGYAMFRECLEIASVDSVLNLVNIRPKRRVVEEEQSEPNVENPENEEK